MTRMLRCACAAHADLTATELAPGLPARHCSACGGTLLELPDHQRWKERHAATATPAFSAAPLAQEEAGGGVRSCPQCTRLMQRYRVGATPDFRIDRCAPCQLAWFDAGEWPALVQAGLAYRLDTILSDAWQRQLQADELRQRREVTLRAKHGDACMDELARIRTWLDAQPQRDELLSLLRAGW